MEKVSDDEYFGAKGRVEAKGRRYAGRMIFQFTLFAASIAAGAIAAISGFGIGSVLTPVVSTQIDTKLAVAIVAFLSGLSTRDLARISEKHLGHRYDSKQDESSGPRSSEDEN